MGEEVADGACGPDTAETREDAEVIVHPGHTRRLQKTTFPSFLCGYPHHPLGLGHKAPMLTFDTFFPSSVTTLEVMY